MPPAACRLPGSCTGSRSGAAMSTPAPSASAAAPAAPGDAAVRRVAQPIADSASSTGAAAGRVHSGCYRRTAASSRTVGVADFCPRTPVAPAGSTPNWGASLRMRWATGNAGSVRQVTAVFSSAVCGHRAVPRMALARPGAPPPRPGCARARRRTQRRAISRRWRSTSRSRTR
jgi:hypothetical protein